MCAAKSSDNIDLKYVKKLISEVMGEDLWNGFYDVMTTERPRVDMYDDGNKLLILAEVSSILKPEDVSVSVSSNKMTLKGTSRDRYVRSRPGKLLKSECIYGAFNRVIELPYTVDEKTIKAVYENGMLEITMKKVDYNEDKTIEVEFKK